MKKILILSIVASIFTAGCGNKSGVPKAPDVKSGKAVSVKFIRMDRDMASLNVNNLSAALPSLKAKYGDFLDMFCDGILGIGRDQDPDFLNGLHTFLTYPVVQEGFKTSDEVFTPEVISNEEKQLSDAFTLYKGTFPDKVVPTIYTYVAGFNQSIVIADSTMGIGLDKYLGANYENYTSMGFPRFLTRKMVKEMIPVDAMYAWASGDFPIRNEQEPLLSHIIYQGKLMYLVGQMLPKTSDTLLFGFTDKQLKWVNDNERMMWETLLSRKMLFNTEQMVRVKMVGDAPFTNLYSTESPGKAAVWQGYRIVNSYMRNTKSTLSDLMKEDNFQKILDKAKYRP